ncbi:MAG: hypothetical protein Q4C55_06265 [Eubacterium sp.]|nr:hypothetical protein [Eubacterium sp.]
MEKKKSILSVGKQVDLSYILRGILWFITGTLYLFDNELAFLLAILLSLISIGLVCYLGKAKKEAQDEMAEANLLDAQALALETLRIILLIIAIIGAASSVLNIFMDFGKITFHFRLLLPAVSFCIIGVSDFLTGFYFRKLEAED